ncbi:MAG: flagellar basal body protein FliL [Limimaricola sp.]|uniref:flagellar basal body-associated FliL family protein n=1 Tax=Limimaricola sp. TaxID=2211665 RepID=UPI001D3A5521|nr:flagellar basal body-associated FliL family protein [Limimaricola sp.]MBI1417351.1 flagellar basal body protein FliL [Limimaricola sp.]
MTTAADPVPPAPKRSRMPLLVGLVLAIVGGGGGFVLMQGTLPFGGTHGTTEAAASSTDAPSAPVVKTAFVALDPLVVSLSGAGQQRFLRFSAQLEVAPDKVDAVTAVKPRIVDVLNTYLRAVEMADLEDPTGLVRLRGQMLRRIQIVTGEGQVKDLLIMEFVLN